MNMIIKKARKEDAGKISTLRRKTIREINKQDYPNVFLKFLINKNSKKSIINKIKDEEIFCAWDGNTLLGTVGLKENKVGGLFVNSSKLGKGIGSQLMDFIENKARSKGFKKVRLYSTKFAFNFYKKRGYALVPSGYWIMDKFKIKDRKMEKRL
jgi:N-acetylglutamate synthase-like GNAT family acetyltransferase